MGKLIKHPDIQQFTDRDVLQLHYNTKIIKINVYTYETKKAGIKITGLQAFYSFKT